MLNRPTFGGHIKKAAFARGVDDGARTHDTRNHNPMLYQLNYIHRMLDCKGTKKIVPCKAFIQKSAKNQDSGL